MYARLPHSARRRECQGAVDTATAMRSAVVRDSAINREPRRSVTRSRFIATAFDPGVAHHHVCDVYGPSAPHANPQRSNYPFE